MRGGFTTLQRSNQCILQPQPTEQGNQLCFPPPIYIYIYIYIFIYTLFFISIGRYIRMNKQTGIDRWIDRNAVIDSAIDSYDVVDIDIMKLR